MTRRLFVCHATADIEATSELVDALENALNFSTGSLWTSSLPGYCADANDMPALGAALAGSDVVLALVTKTSVQDAQFHFQLGAAWALGAHTVLFVLDPAAQEALPNALSQAAVMRGHEPSQWSELIGDLSVRLGLVPRPSSAPSLPLSSLPPAPKSAPPPPIAAPAPLPNEAAPETASERAAPAPATTTPVAEPARRADETPLPAAVAKIANASARPAGTGTTSSASAPPSQPTAAPVKPVSVPPLPRAQSVPPLSAAPTRSVGVPPLPAAVSSSSVIVPPPPAAEDAEPTTTPKAPVIILSAVPEPQSPDVPEPAPEGIATTEPEPEPGPEAEPKAEPKPQPRAAGSYPSVAPQHSYLDELRAISSDSEERTPPRYSYIDEIETLDPEEYAAAASGYEALPSDDGDEDDDDEPETREQMRAPARDDDAASDPAASDSDVFARLPTCEMALEAGRAVSDCLFNRDEIDDFASELDGPLGQLIECLGASWTELRAEQDLDTWVAVADHLLQTLPDEVRKLEEWYRVGFELATLHNLAGQLVLDGSDAAAEQHWRGALERFLMRAERAEIGYENLGRVLGLLENLVGPSHERDLSNIPRSLEELRRYAAGADIHTAA